MICSLYGWKCKSWCKIHRTLLSDKFKSWECCRTDRRGLLSKAFLTRWIFSGDLPVFRRVRALTFTDPVSRHWRTHWPIIFLERAAPHCRSSPNFRQNSRCMDTIDLLNTNCSTQNMCCCTDQRSIVHWIQGQGQTQPPLSATPPTTHTSTIAKSKWVMLNAAPYIINEHNWKFCTITIFIIDKLQTTFCMLSFGWFPSVWNLAYKFQTPGNHPKESIQHSVHGKSLKSRLQTSHKVFVQIL